ncbi:hypothetical protein SAY87_011208 [Trapa incisa]|uniref:Branchless trichome n=1 Tax=Trapa incisa TaxID=236973 RepID=A0AAN7GFS1_9MYRT|nr:hypothetical protein SAY87_011208 [Trapa incisa]
MEEKRRYKEGLKKMEGKEAMVEEEQEAVMMMISSRSCPEKTISVDPNSSPPHDQPINSSSNWKLYQNPFYNKQQHQPLAHHDHHRGGSTSFTHRPPHRSLFSARKFAASFWDFSFFRPSWMDQPGKEDKAVAGTEVDKLRAELERERRARRKLEHINKKLAMELLEERQGRESVERACEELVKEISWGKQTIQRMKTEMEEERKMLRMAEVLREERVQMKLAEARDLLEEKMSQLEATVFAAKTGEKEEPKGLLFTAPQDDFSEKSTMKRLALTQRQYSATEDGNGGNSRATATALERRSSPSSKPENPHIKRGIKGFVEFPRVVRAIGSKGRSWGSKKIEYQKAQIRILLKQRSPIRSINRSIIWGS